MKLSYRRGQSTLAGVVVLAVLIIIIIAMPKDARQLGVNPNPSGLLSSSPSSYGSSGASYVAGETSSLVASESRNISIGSGNAAYAYQPYEEYITIENRGNTAVNLGGWQLKNGKDQRPYYSGSMLQRFSADVAVLPVVALGPGERAIVVTGRVGVQTPYKIENFRENICTGYIEAHPDYAFTPALTQNCPRPSQEPGIANLDRGCREFIDGLSSCQFPRFEVKDSEGNGCDTCINGRRLSNVCAAYVKEHYNYDGCLRYHAGAQNFEGRTWRIFLGRSWEMWADKYETIELYNSNGQLVDYENY